MVKETRWRKSARSTSQNACVELDLSSNGTRVRDSKNPGGGVLTIGVNTWMAFLGNIIRENQSE